MEPFRPGETVYALNPKYSDGTRLRAGPSADSGFPGVWLANDAAVTVLEVAPGFVRVRKRDGGEGWIRERNLTRVARVPGIARGMADVEMVTPDPEYVRGIKIFNMGIKEDPVPGQKLGKGLQHLTSPRWLQAMAAFAAAHLGELQAYARHARDESVTQPGYDYLYFVNAADQLFHRAVAAGLRTDESLEFWRMATWLVMAAAEVDRFPYRRYSPEERAVQRDAFYERTLAPAPGPGAASGRDDGAALGRFAGPTTRRDLLPPIALERLALNNELSALKYADPAAPLRDGFPLSRRVDSLERHFQSVFAGAVDEDHVIHLLWNFHAIDHVQATMPEKNDLVAYAEPGVRAARPPRYQPTSSREKIARAALPPAAVLKLDWNEGAIPPAPGVVAALSTFVTAHDGAWLKWYPHLEGGEELRRALAAYCRAIPENLLVTNGSDDALVLFCRAWLGTGSTALVVDPTYEHFAVDAALTGARVVRVLPADPFAPDPSAVAAAIEHEGARLVYLVSPNNPTGYSWPEHEVRSLAARFPEVRFVLDEAYHEFAPRDPATGLPLSLVPLAVTARNVVVSRTFSKAFCLAALRIGYLVGHPSTIEELRAWSNPKAVNQPAQVAAVAALAAFESYYRPHLEEIAASRERFVAELGAAGVEARSGGGGNFVCVDAGEGRSGALCQALEAQAIYVRDLGTRFPGWVRITVGPRMERVRDAVIEALVPARPGSREPA